MPFSSILCCFRSQSPSQDLGGEQSEIIDERSHLIPTTDDQSLPTPFIDPAQFRERLETIVRKKEGRMVNVIPKYRSRDPSTNFSSNQRNRSRISSGLSSLRTRSVSASDSAQDSDSAIVSPALPDNMDGNRSERNDNEGGTSNESEELPSIVIPVPRKRPVIPAFDDPNVKLSLSWGN